MIPLDPRLPEGATDPWLQRFVLRFNLLWREHAAAIVSRFDDVESQGTIAIPSASTLALGIGNRHRVTGTTTINLISRPNLRAGSFLVLHFEGALTLNHNQAAAGEGKPLMLVGSANLAVTANDQLLLQYDASDDKIYQAAPLVAI